MIGDPHDDHRRRRRPPVAGLGVPHAGGGGAQGVLPAAGVRRLHAGVPGDPAGGLRRRPRLRHRRRRHLHPVLHGRGDRGRHPRRQPAEHGDQHRHRALRRDAEEPGRHADAEERLLRRQDRPGPRRHGADHRRSCSRSASSPTASTCRPAATGSPSSGCRVLGSAACTLLGIAVSSLAKNGRSASAMVTPIALVLQFISGVFFLFSQVPAWMQTVAAFFPLKWMAQGLRSVFLPDVAGRRRSRPAPGSSAGWRWCWASGASPGWCSVSPPSAGRTAAPAELRFPGACTADRREHRPRPQGPAARPPGRRPATADGARTRRRARLPRPAGRRRREPRAPGSGGLRTPARWCSTWRRSRTPSA